MATGNIVVNVVDVGQGQCTFVEIYNTSGILIHTLLFDCGSDKYSTETLTNLQYIADKVSTMASPAFDCMFFSHSDKDHISLTYDLLQRFSFTKPPKVKKVIYGGAYAKYTKRWFNILDYLKTNAYCDTSDIMAAPSNYSGYDPTKKQYTEHFWQSTDNAVTVYPIAANVLSDDPDWDDNDLDTTGKNAEALNRVSMICGLYYAGASYVICGDATNTTMAAAGNHFSGGTTVFNNNVMTTIPHHGSRATGLAVPSSKVASFAAISVVDAFSSLLKSHTLTISAYEKHHHPSLELISKFIPTISTPILRDSRLKEKNAHRLTAYIDMDLTKPSGMTIFKNVSYSFDTTTNTFSTRYSDWGPYFSYNLGIFNNVKQPQGLATIGTTINGFACWGYTTYKAGNTLVEGYANLASSLFTSPTTTSTSSLKSMVEQPRPALVKNEQEDIALKQETDGPGHKPIPVRPAASPQRQLPNKIKSFR